MPPADASSGGAFEARCLYRGLRNVSVPDEFMSRGGSELGMMSTTSDLSVAMRYCASEQCVLLRLCRWRRCVHLRCLRVVAKARSAGLTLDLDGGISVGVFGGL